jgi:hypothetical protein
MGWGDIHQIGAGRTDGRKRIFFFTAIFNDLKRAPANLSIYGMSIASPWRWSNSGGCKTG